MPRLISYQIFKQRPRGPAQLVSHAHYAIFQLAEVAVTRDVFNRILWHSVKGDKPYPGDTK